MQRNQLVKTSTSDGLILHGYYVPSESKQTAVLQIHGLEGNFYENNFTFSFADAFEANNIAYLSSNNRGNGKDTYFNTTNDDIVRVGSRYELLEDAHLDISAWIKFLLDQGYQNIILMGHSAGTVKAVRYLFEGEYKDKVSKLVLLAPIDTLAYRISHGRTNIETYLEKAKEKITEGNGEELITQDFDHDILSYQTFISWYQRNDFGKMFEFCDKNYDFSLIKQISIPTKIIVGSKDEYFHPSNPNNPQEAMDILLKNIPNSEGIIIDGAEHCYTSYEDILTKEVIDFLLR